MKYSKNIVLVTGILALGGISWLSIWMFGKGLKRETQPKHNVLRSYALQHLQQHATILSDTMDVTGDGLPDVVAFMPGDATNLPPNYAFACEQLLVATLDKKKCRTLLTVDSEGVRGAAGQALVPQVAAPQGYYVATALDNRGRLSFILTLRDSAGRPASDPLTVRWDAGGYVAGN